MNESTLFTVFGGQFGSEGKGQIVMHLTEKHSIRHAVRIGGPNAGHTSYVDGHKVVVQSVPTPAFVGASCIIGPEGLIIVELLKRELRDAYELTGQPVSLFIDGQVALITQELMDQEQELKKRIGSTGEGVGAATVRRVMRDPGVVIKNNTTLMYKEFDGKAAFGRVCFPVDTVELGNAWLRDGESVIIEGTQGYGLSLLTSGFYPYCTSRECTPYALWAGTGLNPKNAGSSESVMVVRTYPIRVGGTSGPLKHEISWEELSNITGGYVTTPEITTVTKKIRRIAKLDLDLLKRAILQTSPDSIALTFVDYQFPHLSGLNPNGDPSFEEYRRWLQEELEVPVRYASTGPGFTFDV